MQNARKSNDNINNSNKTQKIVHRLAIVVIVVDVAEMFFILLVSCTLWSRDVIQIIADMYVLLETVDKYCSE